MQLIRDENNSSDCERNFGHSRLANQPHGKTVGARRRFVGFLRWLERLTSRQSAASKRRPASTVSGLESSTDSSNSSPLSANQDDPAENNEITGDRVRERETGKGNGTGQGRVSLMPFLHLGVNFRGSDTPTKGDIEGVLDKAKSWYRYAPNCWLIYTKLSAEKWGERLLEIPGMKDNTTFFLCEIELSPDKRYGWLAETAWKWIKRDRV